MNQPYGGAIFWLGWRLIRSTNQNFDYVTNQMEEVEFSEHVIFRYQQVNSLRRADPVPEHSMTFHEILINFTRIVHIEENAIEKKCK